MPQAPPQFRLKRHQPRRAPDSRPSAWRRGYNGAWRRLRIAYLQRHPLCVMCGRHGQTVAATEVDHILPLRYGGSHDNSNLQALCKACHSRKTAFENNPKPTREKR